MNVASPGAKKMSASSVENMVKLRQMLRSSAARSVITRRASAFSHAYTLSVSLPARTSCIIFTRLSVSDTICARMPAILKPTARCVKKSVTRKTRPGMVAMPVTNTPKTTPRMMTQSGVYHRVWKKVKLCSSLCTSIATRFVAAPALVDSKAAFDKCNVFEYTAALRAIFARIPMRAPPHSTCWMAAAPPIVATASSTANAKSQPKLSKEPRRKSRTIAAMMIG
mmetsp:Transcript_43914/g.72932  ORF Transcript_43914/g.72932 Transcript_43914/m.72932 type:complete len:224 (+) Transcript_43914:358-1029(+)